MTTIALATLATVRGGQSSPDGIERLKRSTYAQVAQYVGCARRVLSLRRAGLPVPANAIDSCRDFLAPLPGSGAAASR